MAKTITSKPSVAVMATCLADALRPQTVQATCRLVASLSSAENNLNVLLPPALPKQQTCCGQILYNAGDRKGAQQQALRVLDLFEPFQAVVVPSGSCAGMLKHHYPKLLAGTPHAKRAESFAKKCWELTEFLHLHRPQTKKPSAAPATKPSSKNSVTLAWHDSCSCLRECTKSVASARSLLHDHGLRLREASDREVCCGFGGKFSVANSAVSTSMADDKLANLQQSGARIVSSCDLGCLLHLAGRARRRALPLEFFHIAELLADTLVEQKPLLQNSLVQKPLPIGA